MLTQGHITALGTFTNSLSPLLLSGHHLLSCNIPMKPQVSHAENAALKMTELEQRHPGSRQFMLLEVICMPQRILKISL